MPKSREVYRRCRWYRQRQRQAAENKYTHLIRKNSDARILVILHLYYQQSWKEIREYLENLRAYDFDLVVTFTEGNVDPAVLEEVKAYPETLQVIVCPNGGFDLGPFFRVLNQVDLDAYDIVFKLQSKSTKRAWIYIYRQLFFRRDWFVNLYEGVLGAENAHLAVDALYNDAEVGLVAAENLIVEDPKHKKQLIFAQAHKRELPVPENYRFVAGTCFAVRASCLKAIQAMHIEPEDFQNTLDSRGLSYAHFIERYLCADVMAQEFALRGLPACGFRRKLKKSLEKLLWRTSSERLHEEDICIDPEFFFWKLDNRHIRYKFVSVPIGSLRYCHDFKTYPFTICPPYRYLEGDTQGYQRYCDYHEKKGLPQMTAQRFDALRQSIADHGYDQRNVVIISDHNVIWDGQHRACCLCKQLGEDAKVRVLKMHYAGPKEFIKRILPMGVVGWIVHQKHKNEKGGI